jgi:hypothetical protein
MSTITDSPTQPRITEIMSTPEPIDTLPAMERWIVAHDTRCQAWWEEQRRWNARVEDRLESQGTRISTLERRVVWLTAAAAAGGSITVEIISRFA